MWKLMCASIVLNVLLFFVIIIKIREINRFEKRLFDSLDDQKSQFEKTISGIEEKRKEAISEINRLRDENRKLSFNYKTVSEKNVSLENMIAVLRNNVPLDISFSKDGMPVYWKPNPRKPYGDYTVYLNRESGIYHADYFCGPFLATETHIFKAIGNARPCKKCVKDCSDFKEIPDWYSIESLPQRIQ